MKIEKGEGRHDVFLNRFSGEVVRADELLNNPRTETIYRSCSGATQVGINKTDTFGLVKCRTFRVDCSSPEATIVVGEDLCWIAPTWNLSKVDNDHARLREDYDWAWQAQLVFDRKEDEWQIVLTDPSQKNAERKYLGELWACIRPERREERVCILGPRHPRGWKNLQSALIPANILRYREDELQDLGDGPWSGYFDPCFYAGVGESIVGKYPHTSPGGEAVRCLYPDNPRGRAELISMNCFSFIDQSGELSTDCSPDDLLARKFVPVRQAWDEEGGYDVFFKDGSVERKEFKY